MGNKRVEFVFDERSGVFYLGEDAMKLSKKSIDEMLEVSRDVLRDVFFFSERQIHAWQNEVMNQLHDKYGWIPR